MAPCGVRLRATDAYHEVRSGTLARTTRGDRRGPSSGGVGVQEPCAATRSFDVASSSVPSSLNPPLSPESALASGDDAEGGGVLSPLSGDDALLGGADGGGESVSPVGGLPSGDDAGVDELLSSLGGGLELGTESRFNDEGGAPSMSEPTGEEAGGEESTPRAALKLRNAMRMRSMFGGKKSASTSMYPRFWSRWKTPDSVSIGSRAPSAMVNVFPESVNATVNVSDVIGTEKLTEPLESVVSPVSSGSSCTVQACEAHSGSRNRRFIGMVGGSVTNVFVVPELRVIGAASTGSGM